MLFLISFPALLLRPFAALRQVNRILGDGGLVSFRAVVNSDALDCFVASLLATTELIGGSLVYEMLDEL